MSGRCETLEQEIRDIQARIDELTPNIETRFPSDPRRLRDERERDQLRKRLTVKEQQLITARRKGSC